jgi:hypothetical protein
MRPIPLFLILFLCAAGAFAQSDQYVISRQGSVTVFPAFQSWSAKDANTSFSQVSGTVSAYIPAGRSLAFTLRGSGEGSSGDVAKLNGLSDAQVGVQYYMESIGTVFSLGVNAPSGKKELTRDEFLTSVLFSNSLFNLQVPVLGMGFNVNPGVAVVIPVNESFVLGLAGAFQYRGPYKPREGLGEYDPGDEITASAGLDYRINDAVSVSTDFVFSSYTADKFEGNKVFASGNAYWVNIQYRQYFRENELKVFAGYRTKSKGQIAGVGGLVDEQERLEPGRADLAVSYRVVFNQRVNVTFGAEGRVFESTPAPFAGAKVFGAGASPVFALGGGFSVPARVKVYVGKLKGSETLTGVEAGAGLTYVF